MSPRAITPREASIFASVVDAVVAPAPPLPPVARTDAVQFFDDWMGRSPRLNRLGLRALLYAAELGPLLLGFGARMRRLDAPTRRRYIETVDSSRYLRVRLVADLVKKVASLCYYGDDAVMRRVGYDAERNLRRGRELRALEGRP